MVIIKGLKFGLILQFAIGPICLMVFRTSGSLGLINGLVFVTAVTLVDALYIFLASIGISSFLEKERIKSWLKYMGSIVLMVFGINIILNCFNLSIIPNVNININNFQSIFLQGLILTLSNPLTIVFWGGVFSGKIGSENYNKTEIFLFGIGCVISTLLFLSIIAITGSIINIFLSETVIKVINGIVGIIIIVFGLKMSLIEKRK